MSGGQSNQSSPVADLLPAGIPMRIAVVFAWTIVAVIATTTAFIALGGNTFSQWLSIFRPMTLYYGVWLIISLIIYWLVEVLGGSPGRRLLAVLVHVLLFLVVALSLPFIVHWSEWRLWLYGERSIGFHTLAAFIYFLVLTGSYLLRFYRLSIQREREVREARLRSSLLENQLNLARMDALKMQINPHFLFNALNSIAALIETERKVEAYHATELLGGLLRTSLDQSENRTLSLAKEVEFVQQYIDVEKVRFGDRIEFTSELDDECAHAEVPILILQPLIENAVKHAVSHATDKVRIVLTGAAAGDVLELSLCDDGVGLAADWSEGYGISNTRKRLELMYGEVAQLELAGNDSSGTCAKIRLPMLSTR